MKLRCFECGHCSNNYKLRKEKIKYVGEGFNFTLTIKMPHCKKCGAILDDKKFEKRIQRIAHGIIIQQRKEWEEKSRNRKEII